MRLPLLEEVRPPVIPVSGDTSRKYRKCVGEVKENGSQWGVPVVRTKVGEPGLVPIDPMAQESDFSLAFTAVSQGSMAHSTRAG